ncbi:18468_t:CDS:2, partial [Funneliformis geosporum]
FGNCYGLEKRSADMLSVQIINYLDNAITDIKIIITQKIALTMSFSEEIPLTPLKKTDKYKSWMWTWFNPILLDNSKTGVKCLVKITDEKICGRLYSNSNSTGNLIIHLAVNHQTTEKLKTERSVQTIITKMITRSHKDSK